MRPWHALLATAILGCRGGSAAAATPSPPGSTASPTLDSTLSHGAVVFQNKSGPLVFDVELALDAATHASGLMFRKLVPDGTGMLFVFSDEAPRTFWMKNTLVPLDMLFLSSAGKVVSIVENAEPLTLSGRESRFPAKYVLEITGGAAFAKGIRVGDQANFQGVPNL